MNKSNIQAALISDEQALQMANGMAQSVSSNDDIGFRASLSEILRSTVSVKACSDNAALKAANSLSPKAQQENSIKTTVVKMMSQTIGFAESVLGTGRTSKNAVPKLSLMNTIDQIQARTVKPVASQRSTLSLRKAIKATSGEPSTLEMIEQIEEKQKTFSKEQADLIFQLLISGAGPDEIAEIKPDSEYLHSNFRVADSDKSSRKDGFRGTGYLGIKGKRARAIQ
jgi:hypothetical protein